MAGANSTSPYWIYHYGNNIPVWSQVILGMLTCVIALLLLTCLTMCCMRLCGCWTGNVFGYGATKRAVEETDHMGCWCCGPQLYGTARVDNENGSYVISMRKDRR